MLLKSLQMTDFRQFKGEQDPIFFSTDPYRNVTVMMGDTGSGKTTLAQAFTWCLYGETDFEDKLVLCKATAHTMNPNNETTVKVKLVLVHNETEYTVIREQRYSKDSTGNMRKPNNTVLKMFYKDLDGQQEPVKNTEIELRRDEIIPKELSRYFFFNGERIEAMSKEISKGRSPEFAVAVRGLLGLSALVAALGHLKGRGTSVIRSYDNSYDARSNATIAKYTREIEEYNMEIEKIEIRLTEIENEESIARDKCTDLAGKIKENARSQQLAIEKEKLIKKLEGLVSSKATSISSMLKVFHSKAPSYFAKKLIMTALEDLSKEEKLDKGIPDIHARTIEYLINRKSCLCGEPISIGNKAYMELNKVLEFIPPQSIGSEIRNFVDECRLKTNSSESLYDDICEKYSIVRDFEGNYAEMQGEIDNISKIIEGMPNVGELQKDLMKYEKISRDLDDEAADLNQQKGVSIKERDRIATERHELTLKDENNRRIETYKAYAQYMYDSIDKLYKEKENETRTELESVVNQIFQNIYSGGLSLMINEKYDVQIIVNDLDGYNDSTETSTGQSISVIFAFIAGVIKMARAGKDPENEMLVSEPYPLVMDAPLSAFDKKRIKTVCDALPKIAEQVIIFIKDTDGELAEENMGDKVGVRYLFEKKKEFETYLIAR
jgi:DNA sulfur modification protein DndD